ncbi:MAG: DNA gyrase/topoisomerase IV subunit A, partial [Bacteroidales bacterium]|nr:DNA gyrase/topoisomerase IV subunit A [Bacteroidales bacterium]
LRREVTVEDITKLTEIKIKRISKFDTKKADEHIKGLETEIEETQNHLNNIIPYTINYYKQIKKKYGQDKERKTEIRNFETIVATKVIVANEKLYANREEGFIGTSLKKDEYICDCSDIDDILVIKGDGSYLITKVSEKIFVGKDIIHIAVFKKNDNQTIYNIVYRDGLIGNIMMKRCSISGLTRDKEYNLTQGNEHSKILHLSVNPNGESEILDIFLKPKPRLKKLKLELDFSAIAIKGKNSMGNILTKNAIHKIKVREILKTEIQAKKIWFKHEFLRLNSDGEGLYLGEFKNNEKILVVTKDGNYKLYSYDLTNHFENNILIIEKFNPKKVYTAIYYESEQKFYYLKRFAFEETIKEENFIGDNSKSKLIELCDEKYPRFDIIYDKNKTRKDNETIDAEKFISIKGCKAKGKRISSYKIKTIIKAEPREEEKLDGTLTDVELPEDDVLFEIENPESVSDDNEKVITNTQIGNDSENIASQMKLNL